MLTAMDNDDSLVVIEIPKGGQWATMRAKLAGTNFLSTKSSPGRLTFLPGDIDALAFGLGEPWTPLCPRL